ncbi:MAG: carboxypeptidase regulatory-like domain-containing protein [Planctomycetes bacterium]|nr:carboxypeptidase regulatory-like domain-containing protein [Planctomycetota bacterium]
MTRVLPCAFSAAVLAAIAPAQRTPCTGTLRDPTGLPIAEARVTFCQELSQTFGLAPDRAEVKTDAAGAFTAPLLPGSPYVVWAIGPANVSGGRWVTGVSMQAAAGRSLDLVAVRRAAPHAVSLRRVTPWKDHVPPALRVLIDGHYPFDFDRPLRGDCTLQLGPWPGYEVELALVDDKRQVLCSVGPIAEDVGEVAFPELRTVEVAAVDESDAPVEGVEVALRPNDWRPDYGDCNPLPPLASQTWRVVARTDAGGRAVLPLAWGDENRTTNYLFAGASAGHAVSFSGISSGKPMIFDENPGVPNRLVMTASPPRRVSVRGEGSSSQGWIALLSYSSFRDEGGGGSIGQLISGRLLDAEARFPATNLPKSTHCFVRLAATAGAPTRICIGESQDEHDPVVDLSLLTVRTLAVRDAAGQPVPFAQVAIAHRFDGGYLLEHDRCVADGNGKVELRSSAVTWDIVAVTDAGLGWSRIEPDDPRKVVPVNLLPLGSAKFRIVDEQGQPVAGARLDKAGPWGDRPDDLLMRETALHLALSQRSDHDGMLVVPMPYGEFREMRIVRGSRKTWRQTVRPGEEVITVELR